VRIENNNRNDLLQLKKSLENKATEKIQRFPTEKAEQTQSQKTTGRGVVIEISEHAKKISEQNTSILQRIKTEGMSSVEKSDVSKKISQGFYNSPEVSGKIADELIKQAQFSRQI
jgi:hypothetical protein